MRKWQMANNMDFFCSLDDKDMIYKNQIIEIIPIFYDSGLKKLTTNFIKKNFIFKYQDFEHL